MLRFWWFKIGVGHRCRLLAPPRKPTSTLAPRVCPIPSPPPPMHCCSLYGHQGRDGGCGFLHLLAVLRPPLRRGTGCRALRRALSLQANLRGLLLHGLMLCWVAVAVALHLDVGAVCESNRCTAESVAGVLFPESLRADFFRKTRRHCESFRGFDSPNNFPFIAIIPCFNILGNQGHSPCSTLQCTSSKPAPGCPIWASLQRSQTDREGHGQSRRAWRDP